MTVYIVLWTFLWIAGSPTSAEYSSGWRAKATFETLAECNAAARDFRDYAKDGEGNVMLWSDAKCLPHTMRPE